jgi:hypothetical protein
LLTDAEQTLSPYGVFPATDANINVFRGKVKYAVEPLLAHYSSSRWYALADKRLARVIVFTFLQGFENGRRQTWYDPKSKSQCFSITGNFGAAAINYRGAVRIGS